MSTNRELAMEYILAELALAEAAHPEPFHSRHEGYAVLLEEMTELQGEVFKSNTNHAAVRKEAAHVGAMAIRFIADCCDWRAITHRTGGP